MKIIIFLARALRKLNYKLYRLTGKSSLLKMTYENLDSWIELTQSRQLYDYREIQPRLPRSCENQQLQLFFDVTTLSRKDEKTGIQRVVRSILREWLDHPPEHFSIQPVFACGGEYYYARQFLENFTQKNLVDAQEGSIDYRAGDIFISIDFNHGVAFAGEKFYQKMRQQGVKIYFVVHDLLCISMPQHFFDFSAEKHERWLKIAASNDGCIAVSQVVADEVSIWVKKYLPQRAKDFYISWFHLGADIQNSVPSKGLPDNYDAILEKLKAFPSFLMVSTLEPRKGHHFALKAFEQLWRDGLAVNLVIVGKQGWKIEKLASILRNHPQLNRHVFWFEKASDEFLEKIYHSCDCLLAASEGEGFGLPLIEAARHGLPIIARDIPIFHEVTQNHALFFDGKAPDNLAQTILSWLILFEKNQHPSSEKMTYLTWQQSAEQLLSRILN